MRLPYTMKDDAVAQQHVVLSVSRANVTYYVFSYASEIISRVEKNTVSRDLENLPRGCFAPELDSIPESHFQSQLKEVVIGAYCLHEN